jgi:hypothetical protein
MNAGAAKSSSKSTDDKDVSFLSPDVCCCDWVTVEVVIRRSDSLLSLSQQLVSAQHHSACLPGVHTTYIFAGGDLRPPAFKGSTSTAEKLPEAGEAGQEGLLTTGARARRATVEGLVHGQPCWLLNCDKGCSDVNACRVARSAPPFVLCLDACPSQVAVLSTRHQIVVCLSFFV